MLKEELVKSNVPSTLAEQVTSSERNNRTLNSEGVTVGDKIKIIALPEKLSEFENGVDANGKPRITKFVNLATEGDRANLSLGALVGTPKRATYFSTKYVEDVAEEYKLKEGETEYDFKGVLALPQREADAVKYVADNLIGKTVECVAVAINCGRNANRTFYLWRLID